jgi:hypothetical protein
MLFDKRLALLLPTQTFNQRMTGEKHKKKNEITFQFHNTIEESALNFLKANASFSGCCKGREFCDSKIS